MDGLKHFAHGLYKSAAEAVLPTRTASAFRDKGVLTPEEFVAAGDLLVSSCPTWRWEGGDGPKRKPYLPKDKQFLVTRNVPCVRRAQAVQDAADAAVEQDVDDGSGESWVAAGGAPAAG
eukprot:CAMPEP_0183789738 /NCGR_PEP_ID=MMETSP0803_2-20130417/614_1 /TAXON_ID=195967 /ORGANISM="Crustomastix stigmata, Strain CCMP3273" /LENGTH=118 /DNA_ID=CAMNT_0026033917 /DNA_START=36 /DNA_END=388 /DNA_ORIENTATION=+